MTRYEAMPGPTDSLTDIAGLQVGNAHDEKVRSGVTVVLPDTPVTMGVDVRGGGPGTRDTEALDPTCLVEKMHGLVLSGGSVFGLAAADGVASFLSHKGIGLPISPAAVPVVPAAILFDLRNGGDKNWGTEPPYRALGIAAAEDASDTMTAGRTGAGYGATAGAYSGGLGTASLVLPNGLMVAAIVAVNSFGGPVVRTAAEHGVVEMPKMGISGTNTTIAAVATNAPLNKAECTRFAMMAQDGLARALRPIHTPFDGDTVFALSTADCETDLEAGTLMALLGTLGSDCIVRAIEKAIAATN
ncbi:P1 family peptidase [Kordiimonas aquimaris]|uniref:P1 family peptidase n=1 Tax=Kordiimonas aquimaris TaxID=707591 RepID=UPI0021CFEADF|nr:P1 family peptidase [Kordiimonas aquimaris]